MENYRYHLKSKLETDISISIPSGDGGLGFGVWCVYGVGYRLGGFTRDTPSLPRIGEDGSHPLPQVMLLLPPSTFLSLIFLICKMKVENE